MVISVVTSLRRVVTAASVREADRGREEDPMATLFGADGVRGVANIAPMTAETVMAIGRAAAYVCKHQPARRHKIVIGKDTRLSGYMFENALTAGICSMGVDVLLVGPAPTPAVAFAMRNMRADAGIVVSASHNPYQDNGIKIFSRDGFRLSYKVEEDIKHIIESGEMNHIRPTAENIGKAYRIDDALGRYIVFCKNTFPNDLTLEGMKVVIDCANGATYKVAPTIFSELGADVTAIHDDPNGKNINDNCGSLHPEDLVSAVRRIGADIGLAFDGDGDRLIAVDNKGAVLDGDHILGICAKDMKKIGTLRNEVVVITPMTNLGLRKTLDALDVRYVEAPVGDRNVLEMMQREGSVLGGEQSGHTIFLNNQTTGDGIVSALQLLAAVCRSGKKASALRAEMTTVPQVLINVNVSRKPPLARVRPVQAAIKKAGKTLGDRGRLLVRYSDTQSMCRVMVEAESEGLARRIAKSLADTVKKTIG